MNEPARKPRVAGFALVPHVVYYLRAEVKQLVSRVVLGRGAFDYWESGMDLRFGPDKYESFVRYQKRLIKALDSMAGPYGFTVVDAGRPADAIFAELQEHISRLDLEPVTMGVEPDADLPAAPRDSGGSAPRRQRRRTRPDQRG